MSIERTIYCDGPDCGDEEHGSRHASTATPPPYVPVGFMEVRTVDPGGEQVQHFCDWDCLMKFAAQFPPEEIVPMEEP